MASLVTAAKAEGALNVIALPRGWCNYGTLIDGFKAMYGLTVNELSPNAESAEELAALVQSKGSNGSTAPDVIDIATAFGPQAKAAGALAPYKVSTWTTIDPKSKDADGYWYGDYYGVMSFEVDTKVVTKVPTDWADLLKPDYSKEVAIAGDPLGGDAFGTTQAIQSVYASALANGGSLENAQPGLDFFKKLNDSGNLVHAIATGAGSQTPIVITWSYLALAARDAAASTGGDPITVVIPSAGRFGSIYAQAISAFAPHPNAAQLWEEYLYSDASQNQWLAGYCYTTRYADLKTHSAISAPLAAKLPDVTGTVFPTPDQLTAAKALITGQWKSVVGALIK